MNPSTKWINYFTIYNGWDYFSKNLEWRAVKSVVFIFVFLIISLISVGQILPKEANNWYFGNYAGLTFNNGSPTALTNGQLVNNEGCASISDSAGNLLFYTNGMTVWNKNHSTMANGSGLAGNVSSCQSGIIVPKPNSSTIYYIFTVDFIWGTNGCKYSIVDMTYNGGLGIITSKNNSLISTAEEKITAVRHSNKRDIWVITHCADNNKFYTYLVTQTGINSNPVISSTGTSYTFTQGYLKASPDGSMLAAATYTHNIIEIYDFNNQTGVVSNAKTITGYHYPYGIEFSQDGTKLYVTTYYECDLFQFNLLAGSTANITNSVVQIADSVVAFRLGALQLGPDGKIYVARGNQLYLGVIKSPNNLGTSCNFVSNGVYLGGKTSKMGLPSFIQSYFKSSSFSYQRQCLGESTKFSLSNTTNIDSVFWKFGEPVSGKNNSSRFYNPQHIYQSSGTFTVKLVTYYKHVVDTVTKNITIFNKPNATFEVADSVQCLPNNMFNFINFSNVGGDSIISYIWDLGDKTQIPQKHISHAYSHDSIFNVNLVVTTNNGCKDTMSKTVRVTPKPMSFFIISDTVQCFENNNFSFSNLSSIKSGTLSYYWDFNDNSNSTNDNPTHTYTQPGVYSIRLISTSSYGCSDTFVKNASVIVAPIPNASFTVSDSLQCLYAGIIRFSNKSTISKGSMNFLWDFGDGIKTTTFSPDHSFSFADTFNVKLIAFSDKFCKDSVDKKLVVFQNPKALISIDSNIQCLSANKFIFHNSSSIQNDTFTSLWYFGDGTFSTVLNPAKTYSSQDTFTVKLKVKSSNGCSDSASTNVIIRPPPEAKFDIIYNNLCLNNNQILFKNRSKTYSINPDYFWLWNDGSNSREENPLKHFNKENTYIVSQIIHDSLNCFDTSISKSITIYPSPTAKFTYSKPCSNDTLFLLNLSHIDTPGSIILYKWYFFNCDSSDKTNPCILNPDSGEYSVTLVAQSDRFCMDTQQRHIIIPLKPDINSIERATVLEDESILLEWLPPKVGEVKEYWIFKSFDGNSFNKIAKFDNLHLDYTDNIVNPMSFSYTYYLNYIDSCGYISPPSNIGKTILLEVDTNKVIPELNWSAYEDWVTGVDYYELQVFHKNSGTFENVTTVYPGLEKSFSYNDKQTMLLQSTYCYRVVAYRIGDHLESFSNVQCIESRDLLWIPNVFTPNNDGLNDYFEIISGHIATFYLLIFNRWGEKIFESSNINNSWDGTFRGSECPLGVYYYQLYSLGSNGARHIKYGTVTLLR